MDTFCEFADLESFRLHFNQFGDPDGAYDVVAMLRLLAACVENLRRNADIDANCESFHDVLTPEQKRYLAQMLRSELLEAG